MTSYKISGSEIYLCIMHPSDENAYPIDTVVRIRKTGLFAIIRNRAFQHDGRGFLNYLGEVEGKKGLYALYHGDIDLECLAPDVGK